MELSVLVLQSTQVQVRLLNRHRSLHGLLLTPSVPGLHPFRPACLRTHPTRKLGSTYLYPAIWRASEYGVPEKLPTCLLDPLSVESRACLPN